MTYSAQSVELLNVAAAAAAEKKGEQVVGIDVSERLYYAEAFLVVSAGTDRQVKAIAENIMDEIAAAGHIRPKRIEGRAEARWILLDYGDVVVHVMHNEDREFYALEKLWGDRPRIRLDVPEGDAAASSASPLYTDISDSPINDSPAFAASQGQNI